MNANSSRLLLAALFTTGFLPFALVTQGRAAEGRPAISVRQGEGGRLAYTADAQGNRVIDFSTAGYAGADAPIPLVPAKIVVSPAAAGADDGARIQAALDLVATMPPDAQGFRGAVLLQPGRFVVHGALKLRASGVVLRGSGEGEGGTVIFAAGQSRRTLIEIGGTGVRGEEANSRQRIADAIVPVGASRLTLEDAAGFSVGDRVVVRRPSTSEWIAAIGMNTAPGWRAENRIQWAPGSRDLLWERTIVALEGKTLVLDAPLTTAIERAFGGGTVARSSFPGRIERVGVENLRCVSDFDHAQPKDEEHAWVAIALDKVRDAWVRQVTVEHFVGYGFEVQAEASRVTIEDCAVLDPVSELAAYRRRSFSIGGQQVLVQRCTSERGLRDFTTGFTAPGPNVFLQCTARGALDWSGPVESWAAGVLYDNVIIRGNALRFLNRGVAAQGAGWAAANSLFWNCEATEIQVQSAPGAANQAYGCKGLIADDSVNYDPARMPWREFVRGSAMAPASLFRAQLAERRGENAPPTVSEGRVALPPDRGAARPLGAEEVAAFLAREQAARPAGGAHALTVQNAQFTIDGARAWTGATNYSWYLGQMPRPLARSFGPAIVRFAPGETGTGATDDLAQVAAGMAPRSVFVHHYGLWYDRRRINHNFYGAPELPADDVTPPFMEMPWARSGQGSDWNGLSKYDLTKFNPWFFARVKEFADLCDARGLILYHNFYFQHALQETRAHYVDFPWRPVNCLQDTGLPDENPAGSTFYDVSHPVRRDLHRRYIRHCLDVLAGNANVVFGIDREYSGPLAFVQFWLDTIAEWEREHGRRVFIALEVPKAEMDALLADPQRRPLITAIDFHNWFYRPDGSLYTIEGGINEAPREQGVRILPEAEVAALRARSSYPGNIVNSPEFIRAAQAVRAGSPAMRYRAWREYRDAFPELVILRRGGDEFPALSAAIERAIPATERAALRATDLVRAPRASAWAVAEPGARFLVYSMAGEPVQLDLGGEPGSFRVAWLDDASGVLRPAAAPLQGGGIVTLTPPAPAPGPAASNAAGAGPRPPAIAWLQVVVGR